MEPRRSRRPRCRCFRPSGFIEPITSDSEILKKKNRLQRSALFVYQCCGIERMPLGIAKPCFIEPTTRDSEILKKKNCLLKPILFVYPCCGVLALQLSIGIAKLWVQNQL
jgi:hypothetical protein